MLSLAKRKRKRRAWLAGCMAAALAFTLVTPYGAGVEAADGSRGPKDAKEVEAFADQFFNRPDIKENLAGASFVVVSGDDVLLNKGYGYADVASKKPVSPDDTLFRIASISKVFTAISVMQQVEEGKIDLDQDVEQYMDDLTIPNRTDEKLTMRHLLTHSSGFDKTDELVALTEYPVNYSLEQYLKDNTPTIVRKPGSAYRYDNLASSFQGYIVQEVTGKPFEQIVDEKILTPLQMEDSDFVMTDTVKKQAATGYITNDNPLPAYPSHPSIDPSGGMFASGSDMSKLLRALLNGGKLGNQRILKEESVKEMLSTQLAIHPVMPNMTFGLEMFKSESYNGEFVVGKGGDLEGYHSWMWLIPEHKVGGFVVTNSDASDVRDELFAAFMDRYYPSNEKERTPIKLSSEQLEPFEGSYRYLRFPFIYFTVVAENGHLTVVLPNQRRKLTPVGDLLFQDEDGKLASFKKNDKGEVDYFYYMLSDAWSEKIEEKPDFKDVPKNDPYAESIYTFRTIGALLSPDAAHFEPDKELTRAELAAQFVRMMGVTTAKGPSLFSDTKGHKYEAEIRALEQMGGTNGVSGGQFKPDRIATREEAAVMLYRVLQFIGFPSVPAKLIGETSPWAEEAVQAIVGLGFYGPDVEAGDEGAEGVDYRSKDAIKHKENAVLLAKFVKMFTASIF
ncbi:serine hydrolase [Paenibacillus sp. GCM10027627]|uniref:serine hydrolase n=1 Tax=unclassified Paenibacillus TaxID=185978 RepID=UPI00362F6325